MISLIVILGLVPGTHEHPMAQEMSWAAPSQAFQPPCSWVVGTSPTMTFHNKFNISTGF
jgi:hypothetical protein